MPYMAPRLFYVKDRHLRSYDFTNQRDTALITIRRPGSTGVGLLHWGIRIVSIQVLQTQ